MARYEAVVTVTSKGQLTLPKPIRQALGVETGTKLGFTMVGDEMRVVKIDAADGDGDPVIGAFLDLVAQDMAAGHLRADLPADVLDYARGRDLSRVDLDEVIEGPVAL